jgi:hypothetical protein
MRRQCAALRAADEHLWVSRETAVRARQQLLPLAEARAAELLAARRRLAALQVRGRRGDGGAVKPHQSRH